MANFWEKDQVVAPVAAQGGPRPVFTAPDPQGMAAERRADTQTQIDIMRLEIDQEKAQREREKAQREEQERARLEQAQAAELADSLAQMRNVVQAAKEAKELSRGLFATGFGSEAASSFGGTAARDVRARLDTIASNTAFDRLQRMREASPTGGALGAVSERELALLQSSISSLDPTQSDEQFRASMDRIIESYDRVINRLAGEAGEQDGTRTPEMRGGVPVGTNVELNMDRWGREGFDRDAALKDLYGIDPNQEAAIAAFWNSNRGNANITPEGVREFYRQIGAPLPSDEDIARGIEAAQRGAQFGSFDLTAAEQMWQQRLEETAAQRMQNEGAPGISTLAAHGMTAGLSDEASGIGGAIGALFRGDNPVEAYRFENALRDYQLEQARENTGWGGTAAEIVGNAASLGLGSISRPPTSMRAAVREGAVAGMVPGFGYGEGAGESIAGAGMGAAAGAVLGRVFGPRGTQPPSGGSRVIQAADDLNAELGTNIRPLPADVAGATTRRATGATAQMPFGASPIINAGRAVNTEGEAAKNAIAARVGTPQELEAAGNAALEGARKWMQSTGNRVNALYTRARKLSEGVAVPLTNARRTLDQHIAELEATPGGAPGVTELKSLRDEFGEEYTIDGIKRMRTALRDRFIGDGIRKSDIERRVGQVIDAAEQDVADGLLAAGRPEAAQAWTDAAAAARERLQTIDNVLAPVIGKRGDAPKSGEQIMQAVSRMAKGDNAKLARFMDALPADEAASVRATVISRLGTKNAEGTDFTLGQFLTQWEKMPDAAKRTLFGGELRASLDKLAMVAGGAKEAQKFANFSNTGSVAGLLATGGIGLSATANPVLAVAGLAGQYGLGRLLASPRFARWLARMPKSPAAQQQHIRDLSKVAAAESAIAADALSLQGQLVQLFPGGSARVAPQPLPLAAQEPTQSTENPEGRGPQ